MHQPPEKKSGQGKDYALGWRVMKNHRGGVIAKMGVDDETVLAHAGSNNRWICSVFVSRKNKTVYMAATNIANEKAGTGMHQIFKTLVRLEKEARGKKQGSND